MTINVWSDSMQHIELLGKPALFSDSRVDRSTVPDGWYVYDLRGSDYDPDLISTLEARVIVNYRWLELAASCAKVPIRYEADQIKQRQKEEQAQRGAGPVME